MPTARRSLLEYSIPQPADPSLGPGTSPPLGLLRTAENVSAGIGDGEVNQLRGLLGIAQHPIQTLNALNEIGRRPSQWVPMIGNALQSSARNAMSGPLGFGQVIGENLGPRTVLGRSRPMAHSSDPLKNVPEPAPAISAKWGTPSASLLSNANLVIESRNKAALSAAFESMEENTDHFMEMARKQKPELFDEDGYSLGDEGFALVDEMMRTAALKEATQHAKIGSLDDLSSVAPDVRAEIARDASKVLFDIESPTVEKIAADVGLKPSHRGLHYLTFLDAADPDLEEISVRLFKDHRQKRGGGFDGYTGERRGQSDIDLFIDEDGALQVDVYGDSPAADRLAKVLAKKYQGQDALNLAVRRASTP